jgi:hypothetical protein
MAIRILSLLLGRENKINHKPRRFEMADNYNDLNPQSGGKKMVDDNKYESPPSPQPSPKAGTTHTANKAGVETGLSMRENCDPDPMYNGMDTVGIDQKPQAVPRESISKNGNKFTIC